MQKIFHLPQEVISKIAAGEVLERPVFAVKELVENSVDAEASYIEVDVEEGGLKKIRVSDDGTGMSKEDITICFLPHTTSKLSGTEIIGINTLGFRGEALSSVAAVSDLTIHSRTSDSPEGWSISIKKGKVEEISPIGIPKGTIIQIDNLFLNIPARRKFLKSSATEVRYITELITKFALSYPEIHFILKHNGKIIIDVPRRDSIVDRLKTLLGISMVDQLIPLSFQESYINIEGFLGTPQISLKNNLRQYLFVNSRLVTDKMISLAVREAFGTLLPTSNTPVFILYIKLPFELVDVNVHPRKEQIAFESGRAVFDAVKLAVIETLKENNISFSLNKFQTESLRKGETTSYSAKLLKQQKKLSSLKDSLSKNAIFQVDDTYIVTSNSSGIVLIDQHAAHERILFAEYENLFKQDKRKNESISPQKPLKLSLSITQMQLFHEYRKEITQLGFEFDDFSSGVVIRAIPSVFRGRNIEKILRDILSDLEIEQGIAAIDRPSQRMLAFLACREAVMAGEKLSTSEMRTLIKNLEKIKPNETCPHGRPTYITITLEELKYAFKRI